MDSGGGNSTVVAAAVFLVVVVVVVKWPHHSNGLLIYKLVQCTFASQKSEPGMPDR